MLKGLKIRLYPNKKQENYINAAQNILKEGKRIIIPMSDGKFKPLEKSSYTFDEEGRSDME